MRIGSPTHKSFTVQNLRHWLMDGIDKQSLDIDLSSMEFIDSMAISAIASLLDKHSRAGTVENYVPPPMSSDPAKYMSRMGMKDHLARAGFDPLLPSVTRHPPGDRFVPLHQFGSTHPAEELMDLIEAHLRDWGHVEPERKRYKRLATASWKPNTERETLPSAKPGLSARGPL